MSFYVVRDAIEEFRNRLLSAVPFTHLGEFYDETRLKDVLHFESSKIMEKFMQKICLLHPEASDAILEEINLKLEQVAQLYLTKNEQSESFAKKFCDMLSEGYRSSSEMNLSIYPYMELDSLRAFLQNEKSEVMRKFVSQWKPGSVLFPQTNKFNLEDTLNQIQSEIEEKHRKFLEELVEIDSKLFSELEDGLLENCLQFRNYIANLKSDAVPKYLLTERIKETQVFVYDKCLFRMTEFINIHKELLEILNDTKAGLYKTKENVLSGNAFREWAENLDQQLKNCFQRICASSIVVQYQEQGLHRHGFGSMASSSGMGESPHDFLEVDVHGFELEINHFQPRLMSTRREQESSVAGGALAVEAPEYPNDTGVNLEESKREGVSAQCGEGRNQDADMEELAGIRTSAAMEDGMALNIARLSYARCLLSGTSSTTTEEIVGNNEPQNNDLRNDFRQSEFVSARESSDKSFFSAVGAEPGADANEEQNQAAAVAQASSSPSPNPHENNEVDRKRDETESRILKRKSEEEINGTSKFPKLALDQMPEAEPAPSTAELEQRQLPETSSQNLSKTSAKRRLPRKCPFCKDKIFPSNAKLAEHLKQIHILCQTCGLYLKNNRMSRRHQATHVPPLVRRTVQCRICLIRLSRTVSLTRHMRLKHKQHQCHDNAEDNSPGGNEPPHHQDEVNKEGKNKEGDHTNGGNHKVPRASAI